MLSEVELPRKSMRMGEAEQPERRPDVSTETELPECEPGTPTQTEVLAQKLASAVVGGASLLLGADAAARQRWEDDRRDLKSTKEASTLDALTRQYTLSADRCERQNWVSSLLAMCAQVCAGSTRTPRRGQGRGRRSEATRRRMLVRTVIDLINVASRSVGAKAFNNISALGGRFGTAHHAVVR